MVDIAKQVVRTSLNLTDQDVLQIDAWRHTADLASEIAEAALGVGAEVNISYLDDRVWLRWFRMEDRYLERKSPITAALADTVTAEVSLYGPEDPRVFDVAKPEKMAKADPWVKEIQERQRERKVRTAYVALAQVTPQRARKYGVNFAEWKRIVNAALAADLKKIAAQAQLAGKRLSGADEVHVTAPDTDLTLSLRGREAILEDGIVDANDIARGHLNTSLPAGFVDTAPLETRGDGSVTFPSVPLWGKMVRGLRFTFSNGHLVDFRADKNLPAFAKYFGSATGDKDRIGFLSIGVNPKAAYLGGFVDHLVAGAVSIGIGGNEDIGGAGKSTFEFGGTVPKATVTADGTTVVEAGRLPKERR